MVPAVSTLYFWKPPDTPLCGVFESEGGKMICQVVSFVEHIYETNKR